MADDSLLKNIIKVGKVSSVDPDKATARVAFETQGLVSHDLQVIVPQTLRNQDYYMPDIGELVVCLFLPTGNAEGFILGSIYSDTNSPPVSSADKRTMTFSDGTSIEYDRGTHVLTINATGPVNIVASGNVNVTGDVIASGISLKNHIHPENDNGGPTGKPQ